MNDADIEMMELAEAGNMAADGICSLCEDLLDPTLPKWARLEAQGRVTRPWADRERTRRMTAEEHAEAVGPVDRQLSWHVWCVEANEYDEPEWAQTFSRHDMD